MVRLLPPPDFLLMPTFGVDLCDQDIRLVCLTADSHGLKVKHVIDRHLPEGIVVGGRIEQSAELAKIFAELAASFNIKYSAWSLPEDLSYIVTMSLPTEAKDTLRESVELQLEEYVPIKINDVTFDVDVLNLPDDRKSFFEVVVGVAAKRDVNDCINTCWRAGVVLRSLEAESQALARAIIKKGDMNTYMIVDFGKRRASFAVVAGGLVCATSSIPELGGDVLTKAIQKHLNVSYEEAEKIKIKDGLAGLDKKSDLFFVVMSHLGSLRDEITNRIEYWNSKQGGINKPPLSKILLCGGQAALPGLVEYLDDSLTTKVELGNPLINLVDTNQEVVLNKLESLRFAKAIGLALRHLAYGH